MPKKFFFTPGPSALYFTVEEHIKTALQQQVPEISHRGAQFKDIFKQAQEDLRSLINIPSSFHIAFASSATEIWERLIQNLVIDSSLHLVNGAFSKRFCEMAKGLGINATCLKSEEGDIPDLTLLPNIAPELIAVTQNETSTGVAFPMEQVKTLREKYPDALIAADVVSSIPAVLFDFDLVDSFYFSVQKCFGLPAGLGVWVYNDRCLEKAEAKLAKGLPIGTYHSLLKLHQSAQKHQTPETPNILDLFLFGQVAGDMSLKGLDMIVRETKYKAALLYNLFDTDDRFTAFAKSKEIKSPTVAVAEVVGGSADLIATMASKGMVLGSGYGVHKASQIRIANFPTHSKEQMELLVDVI